MILLEIAPLLVLLGLLAAIYSSATSQTADEYEARNAELARQAVTDPLTGLEQWGMLSTDELRELFTLRRQWIQG